MRTPHVAALTVALTLAMTFSVVSEAVAKKKILVYSGKLLDERAAPIGGVFPLTFSLYGKSRGGKAHWKESHYVAVDNGVYVIELGRNTPLPRKGIDFDSLWIGVRITGGPELVRERFIAEGSEPDEIIRSKSDPKQPTKPVKGGVVDYAEKAGFAYVAEKADNAVRLDGLTLDQLRKQLGSGGGGKGGGGGGDWEIKLGTNTFNAPSAGGDGGTPYQQLCPDGYVVTGMRGGSGLYVDRVGIICTPLILQKKKE